MNTNEESHRVSVIKLKDALERVRGAYLNEILTTVNDHVVRVSVMTEPYFWHRHADSDETFLVLEGQLGIEFEDHEIVLGVEQMITIPRGVVHRTRPVGGRSVNLTVEHRATTTEKIDVAGANPAVSQPSAARSKK